MVTRGMALPGAVALLALGATLRASVPPTSAYYTKLDPFELALVADLIVDGTVIEFETPHREGEPFVFGAETGAVFTIRVNEVVAGELHEQTLEILEFTDWVCARRYAPYEKGQRALFHLARARGKKGQLIDSPPRTLGGGNDGECPIIGDTILHQANGWDDLVHDDQPAFGHKFRGVVFTKADYVAAIRGLRGCYAWYHEPQNQRQFKPDSVTQLCTDEKVAALEASSDLASRLVRGVRDYQAKVAQWTLERKERRERRGR